jgi:hypothetical protein
MIEGVISGISIQIAIVIVPHSATTKIAVTIALTVATGSSTFHPKRISWS